MSVYMCFHECESDRGYVSVWGERECVSECVHGSMIHGECLGRKKVCVGVCGREIRVLLRVLSEAFIYLNWSKDECMLEMECV